ncbi:DUF4239 domain-containing protein [Actinomadura rubrisoli]|uniref:DUF4239 domain-containing protein n=1 Tax=Actinomadura rubrisoli TaxID=2530368 RepID=A0A4R5A605_9ACTN|nr:DUF4239 domain-containing protein [Actinomadura rubrisoli]TDD66064.1 DUF4239 domain-containing protein [Actinomadura rubrisoli]
MFYWIYDLPNWLLFAIFTGTAVAIAWLGLWTLRPVMRALFAKEAEGDRNGLIELVLTGTGLFYGLLLGLIAAATYSTYSEADITVGAEATALGALYRDVSSYPEPARARLRADVEGYTRYIITEAWPQQRRGVVPERGVALTDQLQAHLTAFEPKTPGQEAIHAEALRQYNTFVEKRRLRLGAVTAGLPAPLWWVLALGAVINLALVCMLEVKAIAAHLLISALFAVFVAMMIFLIAVMDHPFRGEFSIAPDDFELMQTTLFHE